MKDWASDSFTVTLESPLDKNQVVSNIHLVHTRLCKVRLFKNRYRDDSENEFATRVSKKQLMFSRNSDKDWGIDICPLYALFRDFA